MFNSSIKIFKCNMKNLYLDYLVKVVKKAIRKAIKIISLAMYNNIIMVLKWSYESEVNKKKI